MKLDGHENKRSIFGWGLLGNPAGDFGNGLLESVAEFGYPKSGRILSKVDGLWGLESLLEQLKLDGQL